MNEPSEKRINILIVDDMPKNIQAAAAILSRYGYQTAFDEDGESALQHTKSVKFDLILLDILMPKLDGYEVCRLLKADPQTAGIPVIFLTARTDTESIVKGFELGASDYVTKPFNESELLARVKTHLELKQHRDHLEQMVKDRTRALGVMLEVREEISAAHEEKIRANIFSRIFPMLETLRGTLNTPRQKECLDIIESAVGEILSEFSQKLAAPKFGLTPMEIQIAGLIREGKSGKQIADLLCLSANTISFHRQNIRKKLGLAGMKSDLKAFLKSME
jgi:DNA-binding response OmpR family regulator/DNA-binding CsgD family transcriptional regulator